jgi:hypothetical protein
MGYRMSRENFLAGYSPYFLLFGRWPIVGTIIKKVYSNVVDLDDLQTWAKVVEKRAKLIEKEMPIVLNKVPTPENILDLPWTQQF